MIHYLPWWYPIQKRLKTTYNTVDGRSPAPVDTVNIPLFTGFWDISGGAGFLPSTVSGADSAKNGTPQLMSNVHAAAGVNRSKLFGMLPFWEHKKKRRKPWNASCYCTFSHSIYFCDYIMTLHDIFAPKPSNCISISPFHWGLIRSSSNWNLLWALAWSAKVCFWSSSESLDASNSW